MIKLYVLLRWYEYEGDEVVGIYSTKEKAVKEEERVKMEASHYIYDILEFELDKSRT